MAETPSCLSFYLKCFPFSVTPNNNRTRNRAWVTASEPDIAV
jgi:hypothetical protein